MDAAGDTAARLQAVQAELRAVSRELRTCQATTTTDGNTKVTAWRRRVACLLMVLSNGSTSAAVSYLAGRPARQNRGVRRRHEDEWLELLADWWSHINADIVAVWVDPPPRPAWQRRALGSARRFHAQHELSEWVVRMNEAKGVAPKTEELRTRVCQIWRRSTPLSPCPPWHRLVSGRAGQHLRSGLVIGDAVGEAAAEYCVTGSTSR